MRAYMKIGLLCALALGAGISAWAAVGSVRARALKAPEIGVLEYQWSCDAAEAEFILREYGGCVGVFEPEGRSRPVSVTDIEVTGLRAADRAMLQSGIAVRDRQELVTLLEDLGS